MKRLAIALAAAACGYSIRSIVAGAYFMIPVTVVLAGVLAALLFRRPNPMPKATTPRR